MSIGLGIFLFVVGAILVFALDVSLTWIDLDLVGYILMAAGAVIFVLGLILTVRGRNSTTTTRTIADPINGEQVTRRQTNVDDRDLP
jgi:membrane-bound ClpP family serine protease